MTGSPDGRTDLLGQRAQAAKQRLQQFLFGLAMVGLLLVAAASAALAEEGTEGPQGGPSVSQVEEAIEDPGIQAAEMPHTDPKAAEELPHRDLSRDQANELLTEVFGPLLQGPAGIFDELEVKKFYSDNVALIGVGDQPAAEGAPEGTQPTLLESSLPLRDENDNGHEVVVDLGLEKSEGELQPSNPLVDVDIPAQLGDGLSLPQSDIEINLVGAPAERGPSTVDQSVATYPDVAEDTTLAVAPAPTGLETLTLLQSADAPTSQTFHLTLPSGATLQETEDGGAEVSRNGETVMAIRPPSAIDADEASVPVHLETSGSSLTVVAEPDEQSTFPILVDPMWETYYWFQHTTTSFVGWNSFSNSSSFTTSHNGRHEGIWDPGLQIGSGNGAITPGAQARWDYRVPRWATDVNSEGKPVKPTSFISRVIFEKLYFDVQASDNNPLGNDPFFAFYLWDENKQEFVAIGHRYGLEGNLTNMNYQYNLYNTAPPNENVNAKQTSLELVSSQTKSQYRQLYVGLAGIELSDKDFPSFSPLIEPEAWVNGEPLPISFTATDSGLGLREISLTAPLKSGGTKKFGISYTPGCSGGAMSPCPRTWTSQGGPTIGYEPSLMPQGENTVTVDASDPLGHWATQKPGAPASTGKIHINVDHMAPKLAPLSGTLTEQGKVGTTASQYTLKYSASDGDHEMATVLTPFGTTGTGAGQFQRPMGVAVDASGNIWVTDRENNRVEKFDETGKFLMQFGTTGTANGQFKDPRGITISSNGTIWVSEVGNKRVQAFNSKGEFIRAINYASFVEPYGLATGPGGVLWVSDPVAHRIFEFSETGTFIRKVYGSPSNPTGETEIDAPAGLATDAQGNVWMADNGVHRITKFDANGKYAYQFGSFGTGNGQFQSPIGIAIAASGNLLVTEGMNNRVQVFQPSGTYLRQFGVAGSGSGQLNEPRGIAITADGSALVVDAGNRRIAKWSHADFDPQSGVASTEVKVDGQLVEPKYAPGCATRDCTISREWTLKAGDYASGQHNVQVTATDGVGLPTTKSLTVTTVKDTTGPQLTANSAFFTAPEGWLEQKSYSYSASASDSGGYGVTSLVLKIDGKVVKSETQNCSNGGCGTSMSSSINMATYKGGAHPAELLATDAGGNTTKKAWTINVDPKGTISASEAVATLDAADETSESTVVASTAEVIDPAEQEAGNEPGLYKEGAVLESTGTANQSTIAIDPSDGFTVESPVDPIHVEPIATGEGSTSMVVTEGVAAASANSSGNVDTVIRPVFNGIFDYQSIRDQGAPEQYSWEVQLGKNQLLHQYDSQYAAVEYANGDIAYAIMADPAHDSVGTTIHTSLSLTGNIITLNVPHKNGGYIYPVVGGVGWEGGFTTSLAVMPPPENMGNPELEFEGGTAISPPEPLDSSDGEAFTSGVGVIKRHFLHVECSHTARIGTLVEWTESCGNPFKNKPGTAIAYRAAMHGKYFVKQNKKVWHEGGPNDSISCFAEGMSGGGPAARMRDAHIDRCVWWGITGNGNGGASVTAGHHITPVGRYVGESRAACGNDCPHPNPWDQFPMPPMAFYLWPSGNAVFEETDCIDC